MSNLVTLGHFAPGNFMAGGINNPVNVSGRDSVLKAIKGLSGVETQKAENKVVLSALNSPSDFMNRRSNMIDRYADISADVAIYAIDALGTAIGYAANTVPHILIAGNGAITFNTVAVNGVDVPAAPTADSIRDANPILANDLLRKISAEVFELLLKVADPMFEGSKDSMLRKLTHGA